MAKCPLCSRRAAKRSCPAKGAKICSVCCGTKREVEIDCPSDCVHLQQGRTYEADRNTQTIGPADYQRFGPQFFQRHAALITALTRAVLEERRVAPDMVDLDVLEAFKALGATMNTLSAGIYYETLPSAGPGAIGLYRRLKQLLDRLIDPGQVQPNVLRAADAVEALDFMRSTVELHSSGRRRSRQYLDWLDAVAPEAPKADSPRLVVP